MLQIYWSGEAKISTKRGSIRAKWNGSWIGHTTKLWPSILCKILWYKIFILHNLVFIIDHRTPAQSKIQKNPFIKLEEKGEYLILQTIKMLRIALTIGNIVARILRQIVVNEWTMYHTRLLPQPSSLYSLSC